MWCSLQDKIEKAVAVSVVKKGADKTAADAKAKADKEAADAKKDAGDALKKIGG